MSYMTSQNGMLEGEIASLKEQLAAEAKRREEQNERIEQLEQEVTAERKRRGEADARLHTTLEQIRQTFAARGAATPGGGFAGILAGAEDLADRVEQAERQRDWARDSMKHELERATQATARAERAEQERDEACGYWKANAAALERAEADNAALLRVLDNAETIHATGCDGMPCDCGALAVRNATHPGAALLEWMRTTQGELDALRAAVNASPSGAERIHAALVVTGIPEEDEVSGVTGLEEHVGRALERMRALEEGVVKLVDEVESWGHTEDCGLDEDEPEGRECECGKAPLLKMLAALKVSRE